VIEKPIPKYGTSPEQHARLAVNRLAKTSTHFLLDSELCPRERPHHFIYEMSCRLRERTFAMPDEKITTQELLRKAEELRKVGLRLIEQSEKIAAKAKQLKEQNKPKKR
jgi:hypothetical protein